MTKHETIRFCQRNARIVRGVGTYHLSQLVRVQVTDFMKVGSRAGDTRGMEAVTDLNTVEMKGRSEPVIGAGAELIVKSEGFENRV